MTDFVVTDVYHCIQEVKKFFFVRELDVKLHDS